MKPYMLTALAMLATLQPAFAADRIAELPDGRKVVLKDDSTWSFAAQHETNLRPKAAVSAEPQVAKPQPPQQITPNQPKRLLSATRLADTLTTEHSGIALQLTLTEWKQGKGPIAVQVINQALKSVVSVEAQLSFYSTSGKLLSQQSQSVWQSIKRVPETYLRAGKQAAGIAIKPKPKAEQVGRIDVRVTDIDFR